VEEVLRRWQGAAELDVLLEASATDAPAAGALVDVHIPALAYLDLVGEPQVGDRVLLNTTALDLRLGTGGYALVVALPDRLPSDVNGPGHLVKARYTPLQTTVLGVDEQDSPHHQLLRDADELDRCPVVVADLHSSLPAVVAGIRADQPDLRVAYVALDGGALPLAFSRTVAGLRAADWLVGTVTVGQAFGGDLEAVSVHNGLLAARLVLEADVVVVAQAPGNLGTGTRWGFSGVVAGEAVNAVAVLGGLPVAALRVSAQDERERHRGLSHHSMTAYGRVALAPADVVVPDLPGPFGAQLSAQAEPLAGRHRIVHVAVEGLDVALRRSPVRLETMGRGLDDDAPSFLAAAAAGRHAASLVPRAARPGSASSPGAGR
jgi:hypothetical protein